MLRANAAGLLALALTQASAYIFHTNCHSEKFVPKIYAYSMPDCRCNLVISERTWFSKDASTPFLRITITCNSNVTNYTAISSIDNISMVKTNTLDELILSHCELPSSFASLIAHLNYDHTLLKRIQLDKWRGELRREHVQGLRSVTEIVMSNADGQTSIPFDVFNTLPEIQEFTIMSTKIHLEATGGKETSAHIRGNMLGKLNIVNCWLENVPSGAFARVGNIKDLRLGANLIENITSDAFRGLGNLTTLDLSGNLITTLPPRTFEFIPRLRFLKLNWLRLSVVLRDSFEGMQYLESITITHGKNSIRFGARAFASLPALKELIVESTPLEPLPGDLLNGSIALEDLTIKKAGLETIPEGFFSSQGRLVMLDLSGNRIKVLDSFVFRPLKALRELNLDMNNIEEFPNSIFLNLLKLKSISANNNKLKYIADSAFDWYSSIDVISLNYNHLTSEGLRLCPFTPLIHNLKELHLQGNRLSNLNAEWKKFNKLKKLDLSKNHFTMLKESDFIFEASDLVLDLRHNQVANINWSITDGNTETNSLMVLLDSNPFKCDCQLYNFVKRSQSSKKSISRLKIDSEYAQCVSPEALKGRFIRDIPLNSLTCSLPPKDCPANCTCNVRPVACALELDCETEPSTYPNPKSHGQNTTRLRLRSIQSIKLPPHVVFFNLTGLGLSKPPSWKALQNIEELDLSRNNLIIAPTELLKAKIRLRLAGNPFACDCSNLNNVYDLKNNTLYFDEDNVTCSSGKTLKTIDIDQLCEVRKAVILGGALAAVGLITAIAAGFAYRYNKEIKVFLFSRGWCQSKIHEYDLDKDARYDAFVSFSHGDANWVADQLVPKLEGEPNNFKLCVHHRDWEVGDVITTRITTSVEQSRRTIIVLSENFLKSTWAQVEFGVANVRAQRERRPLVLVVVLGDLPDCKDNAELKAYLSTNTYLKWDDPWFWKKLIYAMPRKRQVGRRIRKC